MRHDIISWYDCGFCPTSAVFDWYRLPMDKFVEKWEKYLPQAKKIVPASYDGDLREGVL